MSDVIPSHVLRKVLERLKNVTPSNQSFKACCPAHDDRNPSLSVWEREDGSIGLKCYAGCDPEAVLLALNLEPSDLQPERVSSFDAHSGDGRHIPKTPISEAVSSPAPLKASRKHAGFPTLEGAIQRIASSQPWGKPSNNPWMYHDTAGSEIGAVVRWDLPEGGKEIRPFYRDVEGWHAGAMTSPRPLYRLPQVASAKRVIVTEGEKAADAIQTLYQDQTEVAVTTSPGGCKAGHKADWSGLAGKDVWIFPDNDEPGRLYADTVCNQCAKLIPPPVMRIVTLPGLPEKGDAADFIAALETDQSSETIRNEIERLANAAPLIDSTCEEVSENLEWRNFPLQSLPEPVRSFVRVASKALNVDPSYVALPVLAACMAAVGNTVRVRLKPDWEEPCCGWFVLVGESGDGKSPPLKRALNPLRELEQVAFERFEGESREYQAELATYKKAFQQWERNPDDSGPPPEPPAEPACQRYTVNDITMESMAEHLAANPRGLLIAHDELAGLFNSFDRYSKSRGGDSAKMLELFDGGSMRLDRKTGRKTIQVARALCSLIGGIQPDILKRCLNSEHRESGLAARLLFCSPPRRQREWNETEITSRDEAPYVDLIRKLAEIQFTGETIEQAKPNVVCLDLEARIRFIPFHDDNDAERLNETGELAAAFAKLDRHAARLALIVHLIRWAGGEPGALFDTLDAGSIQSGIDLAKWFGHEARRVYLRMSETEEQRHERQLVEWIRSRGGLISARDLQRGPRRYRGTTEQAESALERLVHRKRGVWELRPPDAAQGGRPSRDFRLTE